MTAITKPAQRPAVAHFSSGPCAKRPGWSLKALDGAFLGRSHRAKEGKARLKTAIDKTKALLGLPPGFHCAIVPASDTGAYEMAMWAMLGPRGVDAVSWESFGAGWVTDITKQLKLKDIFDGIAAVSDLVGCPLVAMVSYAIVFRTGTEAFVTHARESGFSVSDLSRVLMQLEMKRVVRRLPGNFYERR